MPVYILFSLINIARHSPLALSSVSPCARGRAYRCVYVKEHICKRGKRGRGREGGRTQARNTYDTHRPVHRRALERGRRDEHVSISPRRGRVHWAEIVSAILFQGRYRSITREPTSREPACASLFLLSPSLSPLSLPCFSPSTPSRTMLTRSSSLPLSLALFPLCPYMYAVPPRKTLSYRLLLKSEFLTVAAALGF